MSKTIEERLQEAVYIKQNKNMFNKDTAINDAYLDSAGKTIIGTNNYWVISNYIAVKAEQTYTYHGLTNVGDAPYSAYYDKNKQLVSTFKQTVGTNVLTIQNNVCFVRFSINKNTNDINTFQFERGNVATSYISGADRILLNSSGEEILNVDELQNLGTYSLAEQIVGTWIDGKKLYRKVIEVEQLPNAGSITVNHGIVNLKTIWDIRGQGLYEADSAGQNIYYPSPNNMVNVWWDAGKLTITTQRKQK